MKFYEIDDLKLFRGRRWSYRVIRCVYRIKNNINGKFYIGITIDFVKRMKSHRCSNPKTKIDKAIKLFGVENFSFDIIFDFDKDQHSILFKNERSNKINLEQYFIEKTKPHYNEYII